MLHAAFLRSPYAHARIEAIDTRAARALAGVHAVYTAADIAPHLKLPRIPVGMPSGAIRHVLDPEVLASREVCHVGEAVAMVVAQDRATAEDAARLIDVDYAPLAAVVDPVAGLDPGAPRARLDCADNLVASFRVGYGDCGRAFTDAPVALRENFLLHKGGGHSMEGRGVLAQPDPASDGIVVFDSTQMPHRAKALLVAMLGLPEHRVRVVAPDVGGGFGPKFVFYPEEVAVPLAARLLGRPVRWLEDRWEHFVATTQERDQIWDVEIAADQDGRLRGIRGTLVHDHGAYTPYGIALPSNSATNLIGPYVLPAYDLDVSLVITNKVPATPTRGAGRPQGTFVMERLLDRVAEKLGLDRGDIRRRNMIAPDQMPYVTGVKTRDGGTMTYDSGDYPACMATALETAGWGGFRTRQAEARKAGRHIGIGLANYVEGTGRGPFEAAGVRVGPSGRIVISTGATAQGQGVATVLAQICADQLGVDLSAIDVIAGDTAASPLGLGAFASRQAATAGSAVLSASHIVREKILAAASSRLEVAPADLTLRDGRVEVVGAPGSGVTIADLARDLQGLPGYALPGGLAPGLAAEAVFEPPAITYCNGTHVVEVEVDPETGAVRLLRWIVVHDCGRLLNPTLVEGQIRGGVAHGIGQALYEWMRYDDTGQPTTTTYADYLLPGAAEVPRIEIAHLESPSPQNPLGVKGAGESGTIPAAAAIAAAVEDALAPFGVRVTQLPITPRRLLAQLPIVSEDLGAVLTPGRQAAEP
ncbi:hypothetical protein CH341_07995 [Rhodoplanes roseus]|uniref:Aldehyde oxidase/xanthine dehydrogenase a/b hammerhead domain-containing protein n=2 Tax=Rhodoplanes roseus TaxID=29409 RepID=A0A327L4C4_9BRAD|nr:hypothetical protein CH341_07995 [Rhodoplanes roseus]